MISFLCVAEVKLVTFRGGLQGDIVKAFYDCVYLSVFGHVYVCVRLCVWVRVRVKFPSVGFMGCVNNIWSWVWPRVAITMGQR